MGIIKIENTRFVVALWTALLIAKHRNRSPVRRPLRIHKASQSILTLVPPWHPLDCLFRHSTRRIWRGRLSHLPDQTGYTTAKKEEHNHPTQEQQENMARLTP